ncbi:hypothetical protein [Streptomyces sp. NPDC059881]|uniref:hypothetical protein n=1 Tax=Streptomyces sp. NPDC059881 TaxID=3346986 RepID=UPI00365382B9
MLRKVLVFVVWFAVLAAVNKFLIEPVWGELVFTAISTGVMVYILGRLDRGAEH